jgi:hypothetical protein
MGPYKNKIINGNFDIWQRSTSNTSSGYFTADRWGSEHGSGTTKTASRQSFTLGQTDVPGEPTYFMRHVVTTGGTSGAYAVPYQRIESVRTLAGKTATLSFWAKANASKNIATEFTQFFGTGGSPSATVNGIGVTTHALTTSWQKFTTTVSIPSISGKTLGSDSNDFLCIFFFLDAGSTFNARTNSLGNQSGTFDIAQVQLEEGPVATAFEQRHIAQEFALCQRYYQALIDHAWEGTITSGHKATINIPIIPSMRATPSVTYNSPGQSGFPSSDPVTVAVGSQLIKPQKTANATGNGYYAIDIYLDAEL